MAEQPPVPVPSTCLPLMVTFADIVDSKTVNRVDPDDLAASFGAGVRLKAVTLTVAEEPVTEGKVEAVLGWLGTIWPNRLDGQRYETVDTPNRFANSLRANSVSTEIEQ